jgi:hypothetical protein
MPVLLKFTRSGAAVLALFMALFLAGCDTTPPSSGNQIGPGYHPGQMYTLTCDVFISKKPPQINQPGLTPQDKWSLYYLNPPENDAVTPRSVADYRNDPLTWPQIQGVVPAGTTIKFLFTGTSVDDPNSQIGFPFFEIQNGPYANFVVDGSLVSVLGRADLLTPQADPRYLKPAAQ